MALAVRREQVWLSPDGDFISLRVAIGAYREAKHWESIVDFQTVRTNPSSHRYLLSVLFSDSVTISIASISSELARIGPCSCSKLSTEEDKVLANILA